MKLKVWAIPMMDISGFQYDIFPDVSNDEQDFGSAFLQKDLQRRYATSKVEIFERTFL